MITKNFFKEFERLNEKQKEAVEAIEGPVMVVAGPGTGKTQIIAMRIANILKETQIDAGNILALTFTNSGVWAMKKRLLEIIGPPSYKVHIHTFHSFCNEVIQTFPEKFIFSDRINQLSDLDQILIIRDILAKTDLKFLKTPKSPYYYQAAILDAIKKLKQENINPLDLKKVVLKEIKAIETADDLYHDKGPAKGKFKTKYAELFHQMYRSLELAKVYSLYQEQLKKMGVYDYADMIIFVAQKFKTDKELLSYYQEKFQYILVDEYQDTNSAQNEVVRLLARFYKEPNLFVVGDDEQSIYRFQGAALENILDFVKHYPSVKTVILKDNYRSGQRVLDASRELINHNQNQIFNLLKIDKQLLSHTLKKNDKIYFASFSNNMVEDFFIVRKIKELLRKGVLASEIACIYKEHKDGNDLADLLSKANIAFSQNSSENVLNDPDIIRIIDFLTVVDNPYNSEKLFEIMNFSFLGLNQLDVYRATNLASQQRRDLFDILTSKNLKFNNRKKINNLVKLILGSLTDFHNTTFSQAFENLINDSGYLDYLLSLSDAPIKLNRLKSFFDEIKIINSKNKKLNLKAFLQLMNDLQENNLKIAEEPMDVNLNSVKLLTAHQAKGLEFEYVFIMHLTDNRWGNKNKRQLIKLPSGLLKNQTTTEENEEEERRLFYVALTRAKKSIFLTFAEHYRENAAQELPTKFISEIPQKFISKIKTDSLEKQFIHRLTASLKPKIWHPAKDMKIFLSELAQKYILNATALNAYLLCPKNFFFDQFLRVPKVKNYNLAYGSAAHFALERLFKKQKQDLKMPSKKYFLRMFIKGLDKEILSDRDIEQAVAQAKNYLSKYYDFYSDTWVKSIPLALEYNFGFHNVHFETIPINGKIDKIELLDKSGKQVKIIDYKTSSPKSLNHLLGKTQEKDTSFLYQAYFYKLLAENDPLFEWQIKEVEFDFLTPVDDKFKKVIIPIDKNDYDKFKETVKEVYTKIQKLDFTPETKSCNHHSCECIYKNFCENS